MTTQPDTFFATSPDGTRIGCHVRGAGPPLVMVHGVGIDHSCFRRAEPTLAARFTLYLMDRRGRGLSGDAESWALGREFDDLTALVDAIPGPVNLFGHSFGGMCAYETAARSRNVRRLFLYDPIIPAGDHGARQQIVDRMARLAESGDRDEIVRVHLTDWTGLTPEGVERQRADQERWARRVEWAHTMPREYTAGRQYDFLPERLQAIRVPTRVLVGENSSPNLQRAAERIAGLIPGASFARFAGQAHFGFNTAPDAFAAELIGFFGEETAAGAA